MLIQVFADIDTYPRLVKISEETGRGIGELADNAVAEAALDAFRHRTDDPAHTSRAALNNEQREGGE